MQAFRNRAGRSRAAIVQVSVMVWMMVLARPVMAQTTAAVDESVQRLADTAASGAWSRFSTRLTVRRAWVGGSVAGVNAGPLNPGAMTPVVDEYVWERDKTARGWRTRISVVNATPALVRTPAGDVTLPVDRAIARIEDAEDGTPPRFFNRAGVEVLPPSSGARQRFASSAPVSARRALDLALAGPPAGLDAALAAQATGPDVSRPASGSEWIRSFVMPAGDRTARLSRLTRPFGRRLGWVRGYGQYVRTTGARSLELLVDEQDGVPVEANVSESGRLQSHMTFAYERALNGALVRRRVRTESRVPDAGGTSEVHAITEISFSQVQLTTGGR